MLPTVHSEMPDPLVLGIQALDLAYERHMVARDGHSLLLAWASAAECVWWICALDEQLHELHKTAYEVARRADSDGKYVDGLRWVRDRHTHQLPITSELDRTPFLGGKSGRDFYISPGFIWLPVDQVPDDPKNRRPDLREVYAELIAGTKSSGALYCARRWLRSSVEQWARSEDT